MFEIYKNGSCYNAQSFEYLDSGLIHQTSDYRL